MMHTDRRIGMLDVALTSEVEIDVQTKSGAYDAYNIYIRGTLTGQDPFERDMKYAEMSEGCEVPYGIYSIAAENCTPDQAHDGLGCARYYGVTTEIKVMSFESTSVSVDCRMVNSKATVTFADDFLSEFDEGSVSVDMEVGGRKHTITPPSQDIVYFNVDSQGSEFTYTVHGSIDGTSMSYLGTLLLRPAKFARITIKSNHNGILGPDIDVQDETEIGVEEISGEIDLEDGEEITGGTVQIPVIYVDYEINPAVDVDCILDIL